MRARIVEWPLVEAERSDRRIFPELSDDELSGLYEKSQVHYREPEDEEDEEMKTWKDLWPERAQMLILLRLRVGRWNDGWLDEGIIVIGMTFDFLFLLQEVTVEYQVQTVHVVSHVSLRNEAYVGVELDRRL